MTQNSARFAVAAAFLAAGAGAAFYFLGADAAKVRSASLDKAPSGPAYVGAPVPVLPEVSLGWKKTERTEDDLWTYDLFTPVQVKWNSAANAYEPKGAVPEQVVPFGLRLIALRHPQYRYKVSALFEGATPAETTIVLNDSETGALVRGRIGQTVGPDGGKITLLAYDNKPVAEADGSIRRPIIVKIKDITLGSELSVTREPIEFADKVVAQFAAESSDTPVWTASAGIGSDFNNEAGSFVIKGIDFAGRSVTVEKTLPENPVKPKAKKIVVETLVVSGPVAAK